MLQVEVLLFAGAAAAAGCRRLTAHLPAPATVGHLAADLGRRFPALAPLIPCLLWAVNEEYAPPGRALRPGDRVAAIPPVSGGAGPAGAGAVPAGAAPAAGGTEGKGAADDGAAAAWLVEEPISVDAVLRRVCHPDAGAVALFLGTVRRRTGEALTEALEYEAYRPMAERELAGVARAAARRWPGCRVAIVHRLGLLPVGEVSVAVAVAAPHRGDAFAACRFAIDRLKQVVPIWKREIPPEGEPFWVHPAPAAPAAGGTEGAARV